MHCAANVGAVLGHHDGAGEAPQEANGRWSRKEKPVSWSGGRGGRSEELDDRDCEEQISGYSARVRLGRGEKNNLFLPEKLPTYYFYFYGSPSSLTSLGPNRRVRCERYGGPDLGKKDFLLFSISIVYVDSFQYESRNMLYLGIQQTL